MTRRINRIAASGGRYLQDPGESDFIRMVIDMLEFTIAIKEDKVVSKLILETLFDKNLNGGTSLEIMRKVSEASIKNTGDNTEILSLQNSILNILEELYLDNECLYGIEKEHSAVRKIVEQNLDK